MSKQTVTRYDKFVIEPIKMIETPEGYLTGEAYITRIGVFPYLNTDGTIRYEARLPEDVFREESIASAKMIPMTLEHPTEFVKPDNSKRLQVGFLGENVRIADDNRRIIATYKITDAEAIREVKTRNRIEISMGYTVVLILESGKYDGIDYTHRQTEIYYNHCAIVKKGRAGSTVKLITDRCDAYNIDDYKETEDKDNESIKLTNNNNNNDSGASVDVNRTVKVTLDNACVYDADPEVKHALDSAIKDYQEAKKTIDSLEAEKKDLTSKLAVADANKKELEEKLKNVDSVEKVNELVKDRMNVIDNAKKILGADAEKHNFDSMNNIDIKKTVISSKHGKETIDGQDDVYISSYFDCMKNTIPQQNVDNQMKSVFGSSIQTTKIDSEEARKKMIENRNKAGK